MEELRSYSLPNPSRCQDIAFLTLRRMNADVMAFVNEVGGWDQVPDKFDVLGAGWVQAEAEIDAAVAKNDATAATKVCSAYQERVERYLQGWRAIVKDEKPPSAIIAKQEVKDDDWD